MATDAIPISARVAGRNLFIGRQHLSEGVRGKLKSIPVGNFLCSTGALMFPADLIVARRLRKLFGSGIAFDGRAVKGNATIDLNEWCERYELAHRLRDAEALPDVPGERMPSWDHQKRGFWFGYHLTSVMLSEKVGAGKTKQMLDIACARDHKRILVTTTAGAVDDWPSHIAKHAWKPYKVLALGQAWRAKNASLKADAVEQFVNENEYSVVAISHDSIWRPPLGLLIGNVRGGSGDIGVLAKLGFHLLIIDEIHKAASATGRRALFLWRLRERIPFAIAATGTIVKHKVEDVFAQYRILEPGLFGVKKDAFLERYCIFNRPSDEAIRNARTAKARGEPMLPGLENLNNADPGPRYVVGYQRTDELAKLMSTITYDPGEVDLHLPIPIFTQRRCYMPHEAQAFYDDLAENFVASLPAVSTAGSNATIEIITTNVLTQMLRLHQCAGGFVGEPVIDPNTGEVDFVNIHEVHSAKEDLLTEVISDIDSSDPIVIVCRFKHDITIIRRVCKRLGRKVYEQSGVRKERIKWQEATGGEILVAQVQSACEAIDLTRSRYQITFSIGFSLDQRTQMIGRQDRPGQTRQPCYIDLVTHNSIDEKIYKAIAARAAVAKEVVRLMRNSRLR
jgi:hypothetical protein